MNKDNLFLFYFGSHIKRGYFSLWRNILYNFLQLLTNLFPIYVLIILYSNILEKENEQVLNLAELLEKNDIYICENNLNFLEESFVAKDICSIDFKSVDNTDKNEDFIENIYQNALGHLGKSGICVTNLNSINKNNNYEIINSEIPLLIPSYIMANSMLIISAFLKKEYNINAIIFDKIVNNSIYAAGTFSAMKIVTLFVIILTCSMSLALFLGIIGADKIKERVKNIKQLLYLSGSDM